jgi:hypothetical protein
MASLDLDALWTVAEAAEHAGVAEATVRSWVHRGHLRVAMAMDGVEIRDHQSRCAALRLRRSRCSCPPRYRPLDVARAEFATRERARRVVAA